MGASRRRKSAIASLHDGDFLPGSFREGRLAERVPEGRFAVASILPLPPVMRVHDAQPLVVLSNRLPFDLGRRADGRSPRRNVGGLVSALAPVLEGRNAKWIGWDGGALPNRSALAAALEHPARARTRQGLDLVGVPITEREVASYYHGFANRALWPLLHDFTDKAVFAPEEFIAYERVNLRFAETAVRQAAPGARIWVHDFHLMRVPALLSRLGFPGRVDFFLHTPFPPPEIFRIVPWREELLAGMLAAKTAAFHTELYRDNFVRCATEMAGARLLHADRDGNATLRHAGGTTTAAAVPIGIDVDAYERIARRPEVAARAAAIRAAHRGARILFCADRLDYTKGIRKRLRMLEHLIVGRPETSGRVVLLQVVVPSRHQIEEYRAMKRDIDREVGRIAGEHGRDGWVPIHYHYRALDRVDLVAHYLAADVALVTPLRDGMNLVASEFAAARIDGDGVLVLSEFAGAAERSPGALLVNPYDVEGFAAAVAAALGMPTVERRRRMATLRDGVRSNPVGRWAARCLGAGAASNGRKPGGQARRAS